RVHVEVLVAGAKPLDLARDRKTTVKARFRGVFPAPRAHHADLGRTRIEDSMLQRAPEKVEGVRYADAVVLRVLFFVSEKIPELREQLRGRTLVRVDIKNPVGGRLLHAKLAVEVEVTVGWRVPEQAAPQFPRDFRGRIGAHLVGHDDLCRDGTPG